jgi:hypothetical protein
MYTHIISLGLAHNHISSCNGVVEEEVKEVDICRRK